MIAGSLSLNQLILHPVAAILHVLLLSLLPAFMELSLYKVVLSIICFSVSSSMAIRIRGELVMARLMRRIRYNLRPRYYVYNQNDQYLREIYKACNFKATEYYCGGRRNIIYDTSG